MSKNIFVYIILNATINGHFKERFLTSARMFFVFERTMKSEK